MQSIFLCRSRLVLFVALMLLLGCSRRPAPPPPEEETKGQSIGISLAGSDSPWRAQMKADIKAAAAKHPELRVALMEARDVRMQLDQLEGFLGGHAGVVIVSPADPQAITNLVAKLVNGGTAVIVLDRAVIGDKYTCFIAADPTEIGTAAGKWLAGRLQRKGNIVELRGPVGSLWAEDLHKAWRAVLRDPGYHFVYDARVDPPRADAGKLMREALGRVGKIDVVFAYDDAAAKAAYEAAKTAGREKGVLFMGVGGLPKEGANDVAQGILAATFLHPTGGTEAVDAAVKILHGEKVPKKIVLPTRAILQEKAR